MKGCKEMNDTRRRRIWQGSSKDLGYLKGKGKGEEQGGGKQESDLYQQK